MNLLLFGPPGAGKGTQSAKLIEKFSMKQISTGDLFRNAIKNKTNLGLQAKSFMDRGALVPDELVTGMVEEALVGFFSISDCGLILDGFPRTLEQAKALNVIVGRLNKKIDKAIFIKLDSNIIIDRLVGRRVCKSCDSVYHVRTIRPIRDGICDKCGSELIQRNDDKEDVILSRLEIYFKSSDALSKYYKEKNCFAEIEGHGSSDEVFNRLVECLKS